MARKTYGRDSGGPDASWWKPGYVFSPRQLYFGERDETMEWLYKARGLIGFIIIMASTVHYEGTRGIGDALAGWAYSLVGTVFCVIGAAVAAGALLVALTHPGRRRAAAWQLRWPFITFAALAATFSLWLLLVAVTMYGYTGKVPGWVHAPWLKPILASLLHETSEKRTVGLCAMLILLTWNLYLLRAVYLCATGLCRAADGHPLLPPLIAPLAATALAVRSLLFTRNDITGVSQTIHLALLFGGPVSLALLAVVEVLRLSRDDQFPFRWGPPSPDPRTWQAPGWT